MTQYNSSFLETNEKYFLKIHLGKFEMEVMKQQYDCLFRIINQISSYRKFIGNYYMTRKFRYFRPDCSVKENPKLWWKYAIGITLKKMNYIKGE